MEPCLTCGGPRKTERLCDPCCQRVLGGIETSVMQYRRLRPRHRLSVLEHTRATLRILQSQRAASVVVAFLLLLVLSLLVTAWIMAARILRTSTVTVMLLAAASLGAGLPAGWRIGRGYVVAVIRWYMAIADRPNQSYLASILAALGGFIHDRALRTGLLATLGLLVAVLLLLRVSCRSSWASLALAGVLTAMTLLVGLLNGTVAAQYRYGDWVTGCARRLRVKAP